MKEIIKKIPVVGNFSKKIYYALSGKKQQIEPFPGSQEYWIKRYRNGGNSGAGSYNQLAEFKAEIINDFVKKKDIEKVIEFGCGDGNQLRYAEYPSYIGFDISPKAVSLCQDIYKNDKTKQFKLISDYSDETAPLTLSLDVIFHLIEDEIFHLYMDRLFKSSEKFVIIYSSNYDERQNQHEKHRQFTKWIENEAPQWKLLHFIPNRFPYRGTNQDGSLCDFFIYEKMENGFEKNTRSYAQKLN